MTDEQFDRLTRVLSGSRSRRQALATLGALAAARLHATHAAQIQIAACGEAGAVCIPIKGCCEGLVCATSTINPAYGVCVTGEGGMLPVSDSLVVPTGTGIQEELAQEVSAAAADATAAQSAVSTEATDHQAQIDAKRAKKDTRRSSRRSTNTTQRTTRRSNRSTRRTTEELNATSELSIEVFSEVPKEETADPNDADQPEIVRVRNLDSVTVTLLRIESISQPDVFKTLSTSISVDGTLLLLSGQYAKDAQETMSGSTVWTEEQVCFDAGDVESGVILTAENSGGTRSHLFKVLCDESISTEHPDAGAGSSQQRQRNHDQQQRRQVQRRDAHHHRQDHKHATRGKGK